MPRRTSRRVRQQGNVTSRRSSRGRSPDNPARARQSPQKPSGKACSCRKIPAYSRSARKRQDRPVTAEVAGSSPVTRAEDMRPRVCGSTFRGCTTCAGGRSAASLPEKRDTSGTHDPTKPLNGSDAQPIRAHGSVCGDTVNAVWRPALGTHLGLTLSQYQTKIPISGVFRSG